MLQKSIPYLVGIGFVLIAIYLYMWIQRHPKTKKWIASCLKWFDGWPSRLKGMMRLFSILTGIGGASAHHAASLYVLFVGFCVELSLIHQLLLDKNVNLQQEKPNTLVNIIILILLLPLFLHQFLIFRNFTLSHSKSTHTSNEPTDEDPSMPTSRQFVLVLFSVIKSIVEFFICLAFGVISGEAGYLYAVSHVNTSHSPIFHYVQDHLLGTDLRLGLEKLFVFGALIVCILVLVWDASVSVLYWKSSASLEEKTAPEEKERGWKLIRFFWAQDLFSLFLWLLVGTFLFDQLNNFFFNPTENNRFIVLYLVTASYFTLGILRLWHGIRTLGQKESLAAAMLTQI